MHEPRGRPLPVSRQARGLRASRAGARRAARGRERSDRQRRQHRGARLRGSAGGELGRLLFPQGRAARGRALSGPPGVRADRARLGRVRHGGGAAPHARRARRARVPGPYRLRSGVAFGDRGAAHRRRRARWVAARGARSRQSARGALRRGRRPRPRVARRALRAEHPGDERARESRMTGPRSGTRGLAAGSAAFAIWGLFPLYLHPLSGVPATQVNVALGVVVLHERLNRTQWLAVALAAIAVGYLTVLAGRLPWIACFLALTFSLYGLLRKVISVEALPGLASETLLLLPLAVAYLGWCQVAGTGALGSSGAAIDALLVGSGLVTAIPLLLFAYGARRLPYSTV